jgi:hypothetical protein
MPEALRGNSRGWAMQLKYSRPADLSSEYLKGRM